MYTLKNLKEQIKATAFEWDYSDERRSVLALQACAELILSGHLTFGTLSFLQTTELMQELMGEYGYDYPIHR